jgi:SAM-dependent methyltransferase
MIELETRNCTACGPGAEKKVKYPARFDVADLNATIFSARRSPDRKHFRLVECGKCGIIYSDPACDSSHLSALYQKSTVNYGGIEEQIYQSYSPVLDRGLAHATKKGTFLEIGGGRGFMLRYGAEKGFHSQIEIEPSTDAELKFTPPGPHAKFIRGIFVTGTLPKNSVSFACFFQMLDHVPNPKDFLRTVYDTLEPGGVAVCVTHNTRAFSAKLLGERSPIYDIEHTYLFHPENLAGLFGKVGFGKIETFRVANRYAIRYWLNLLPIPKFLRRGILAFLTALGLSELPVRLNAGNFGIIGVKPPL